MKKILLLLFAVPALVFTGCNDDDTQPEAALEIVRSDVGFDAVGGSGTIAVRTTATAIEALSTGEWLSVDSATPSMVTYTVASYEGALDRSAQIIIRAGLLTQEVTITQVGAVFEMNADPITVDAAGLVASELSYDATTPSLPTVSIPSDASWLHATVENGKIKLLADLNYETPRSTSITVQQAWKPVEIVVSQGAVNLVEVEDITSRKSAAIDMLIEPTQYLALAAPDWSVRTAADWLTVEKSGEAFTVKADENDTGTSRSTTIELVAGSGKVLRTIPVSQGVLGYAFFLGEWTMPYTDFNGEAQSAVVEFVENEEGNGYLMNGWLLNNIEVAYVETENDAYLSLTAQYLGKSGIYFVYIAPLFGEYVTRQEGVGMNFIYATNSTLTAVDNGVNGEVSGFQIAGYAQEGEDLVYKGGFETYDNLKTLTRR